MSLACQLKWYSRNLRAVFGAAGAADQVGCLAAARIARVATIKLPYSRRIILLSVVARRRRRCEGEGATYCH